MITKGDLKSILDEFANDGMLFSNERQFQLALAWKLKENGHDVYLEMLDSTSEKKKYIDIVIDNGDKTFTPIELKYTTKQKELLYRVNGKSVPTFSQGAADVRMYDFLCDVQRIENMIKDENPPFDMQDYKVINGFCIIVTNDKYWSKGRESTKRNSHLKYEMVALYDMRRIPKEEELWLQTKGYEDKPKVKLNKEYICQWQDYSLKNTTVEYDTAKGKNEDEYSKHKFKYMIFEVNS